LHSPVYAPALDHHGCLPFWIIPVKPRLEQLLFKTANRAGQKILLLTPGLVLKLDPRFTCNRRVTLQNTLVGVLVRSSAEASSDISDHPRDSRPRRISIDLGAVQIPHCNLGELAGAQGSGELKETAGKGLKGDSGGPPPSVVQSPGHSQRISGVDSLRLRLAGRTRRTKFLR